MVEALDKICVIVGAGASYDVWNGVGAGYGDEDEWRPPLTAQLFDQRFLGALNDYPGARVLAQELGPLAAAGALNLEEKLGEYRTSSDYRVRAHYSEVPAYVRDVIYAVAQANRHYPGCYTQLAKAVLADVPHDVLFLTTNYDDLLERSLSAFDEKLPYEALADYVAEDRQAKVVKIHGSIDWFVPLASSETIRPWHAAAHASDLAFDPQFVRRIPDITRTTDHRDLDSLFGFQVFGDHPAGWLYPYIIAPEADKNGPLMCPKSHEAVAAEFIAGCDKFLVLGSSGLDQDLFHLINTDGAENARVHLVGGNDAFESAFRFSRAVPRFAELGDRGTVFTGGLKVYLAGDSLGRLLADPTMS